MPIYVDLQIRRVQAVALTPHPRMLWLCQHSTPKLTPWISSQACSPETSPVPSLLLNKSFTVSLIDDLDLLKTSLQPFATDCDRTPHGRLPHPATEIPTTSARVKLRTRKSAWLFFHNGSVESVLGQGVRKKALHPECRVEKGTLHPSACHSLKAAVYSSLRTDTKTSHM